MKKALLLCLLLAVAGCSSPRQHAPEPYFSMEEMPDLSKCLPAPPAFGSLEFTYDSLRYEWGKRQRSNPELAAMADHDARWETESFFATFNEALGLELSARNTPRIWECLNDAVLTMQEIRVLPKKHFNRRRPFEYFDEHMLTAWEEEVLRGEGSYPSGHAIRGWSCALLLAEIAPDRAEQIYARAWQYGTSRVIAGAHWQSDVDASYAAASIAYAQIHTSKTFQRQVSKARKEYKRLHR